MDDQPSIMGWWSNYVSWQIQSKATGEHSQSETYLVHQTNLKRMMRR